MNPRFDFNVILRSSIAFLFLFASCSQPEMTNASSINCDEDAGNKDCTDPFGSFTSVIHRHENNPKPDPIDPNPSKTLQTGPCPFYLTQARVLGDGRIVRLQWESGESVGQSECNRLAKTGFPDYQPGNASGISITASYTAGSTTTNLTGETIAVQSVDHNRSQAWLNKSGFVSGGTLSPGAYMFQLVLTNGDGVDVVTHLWTGFASPDGGEGRFLGIPNDTPEAKVLLQWTEPMQPGWSAKVYGTYAANSSSNVKIYDMRLLKIFNFADLVSPTSLWITDFKPSAIRPVYKSTTWVQYILFKSPIPFAAPVSLSADAGLLQDDKGNITEAIEANVLQHTNGAAIVVNNESVVGTDDWLAIPDNTHAPFGTMTFADTIHVSHSRGSDTLGNGSLNNPYKTALKAFTKYDSNKRNINIRFLRGDTFPAGMENQWTRSFWGTSRAKPFLIDSYWNPNYGSDPGTRPVIELMHPYWHGISATKNSSTFALNRYNAPEDDQSRPFNFIRGLYLKGDTSFTLRGQLGDWPTLSKSNHQIISDTRMSNVELIVGKYAPPGLPTTGSMIHRSMIHEVQSGGADMPADKSDNGIWSGGVTLYLPKNMTQPILENKNISAGDKTVRFWGTMPIMNLTGWQLTITDGNQTDTGIITEMPSAGSLYAVYPVSPAMAHSYIYGANLSATLKPASGTKFRITLGTGASSTTVYTITMFDPSTRAATVTPAMPQLDGTSRIVWGATEPEQKTYFASAIHANNTADFLFSQNVLDHNGWSKAGVSPEWNTVYSHGIYAGTSARDWMVWGNWVMDNANFGVGLRGGGPIAYNIIAANGSGIAQHNTSSMAYRNVFWKNGNTQMVMGRGIDDIPNHVVADFNLIISPTMTSPDRLPLNGGYGVNLEPLTGDGAPAYMVIRNNTFIGSIGPYFGGRPPVPGKFIYTRNLVDNGAAVQPNGSNVVAIFGNTLVSSWNTNGPVTVPTNTVWNVADRNAYRVKSASNNWNWLGVNYGTLDAFKKAGNEPNSILLQSISYNAPNYGLDSWGQTHFAGTTFVTLRNTLKSREESLWGEAFDAVSCYNAFRDAYRPGPEVIPPVDSSAYGFYGAGDSR